MRPSALALLIPTLLALAPAAARPQPACAWQVGGVRPARETERGFETRLPVLRDPADPNDAPGPDSLAVVVRTDAQHHPGLWLEDRRRGTARRIGGERWLSQPHWSPDGRRIACTLWSSRERPWVPCIIDLASGVVTQPAIDVLVSRQRWSPDGRRLAIGGTLPGRPVSVLAVIGVADGVASVLDTMPVFSDYTLSWSPDSRALAVVRPRQLDEHEEVLANEIWVFEPVRARCRLALSGARPASDVRWLDGSHLLVERPGPDGRSRREVVTLTRGAAASTAGDPP